jgi:FkbM family methyltransferase
MGLLRNLRRRLALAWHRPRHWRFRKGTFDRRAFREVVVRNEYRLPARLPVGAVVLDVGANVGTFALAALRRGAGAVHCFEPEAGNFAQLRENLAPFAARVRLHRCALWRSDLRVPELALCNPDRAANTGAIRVAAAGGETAPARAFDEVVAELSANGRPLWVKLDCEGAEWPILFTSRLLDRAAAVFGEYHLGELPPAFHVAGAPPRTAEGLVACLRGHGLTAEAVPHPKAPARVGHFFARRHGTGLLVTTRQPWELVA